jgi:hypothetical protein
MKKAADAIKKKAPKLFPPESLASTLGLVDNLSLRKSSESSKKVLRELRAKKDVAVVRILKRVTRRLDEVIRTSANALRDLSELAADTDRVANSAEKTSVTAHFRVYQSECNALLDSGSRILRIVKRMNPGLPDNQLRRALKLYRARSQQVDQMLDRYGRILNSVGSAAAADAE